MLCMFANLCQVCWQQHSTFAAVRQSKPVQSGNHSGHNTGFEEFGGNHSMGGNRYHQHPNRCCSWQNKAISISGTGRPRCEGSYTPGKRWSYANKRRKRWMFCQRFFSIHTKHNANMRLKFIKQIKFGALSVALKKNWIKVALKKKRMEVFRYNQDWPGVTLGALLA